MPHKRIECSTNSNQNAEKIQTRDAFSFSYTLRESGFKELQWSGEVERNQDKKSQVWIQTELLAVGVARDTIEESRAGI